MSAKTMMALRRTDLIFCCWGFVYKDGDNIDDEFRSITSLAVDVNKK